MALNPKQKRLQSDLQELVGGPFPGMTVEVAHSDRWDRMCVTFRWAGFAGLLPEERFHRLTRAIPEDVRHSRLQGFVWLELAPDETVDAFLKLPRSEDIADRERQIYGELKSADFFDSLRNLLGPNPEGACGGDFSKSDAALADHDFTASRICDAKLLFIRHGVYCDCQVLHTVEAALRELYAGAA